MTPKWNLSDIRTKMFNRPLMVTREKALDALGVMGPRLNVGALIEGASETSIEDLKARALSKRSEMETRPGDERMKKLAYDPATGSIYEDTPYENWRGAAIFEVRGTLMAEHGIDPMSGATGYDGLSKKVRWAVDDPDVKGGILDIDSPGGEVVDLLELCSLLREFAAVKPLRAVIRGQAASAGYALAACAGPGNITAASYSIVGSIGSIMMHADYSKQLEDDGIDVTMITSAAHKDDASFVKPLEAEVKSRLQAMVKDCADDFIDHVADARQVDRDAIVAQEARFYSNQDSLNLGLVDKFMPWDESMKEFTEALNRWSNRPGNSAPSGARSTRKENSMSTAATAPAADSQPGISQEAHEQALGEAKTNARAEGVAEAETSERQRVADLVELDAASTVSPELASAIADGTSAGDFAIAQAKASKAKVADAKAAAKNDAVAGDKLPEGGASASGGQPEASPNRGRAYVEKKAANAKA